MSLAIFYATYDNLADGLAVGPLPGDVHGQFLGWYIADVTQLALLFIPDVETDDDLGVPSPDYYNRTSPAIWVVQFLNAGQAQGQSDSQHTPTFTSDESPTIPSFT